MNAHVNDTFSMARPFRKSHAMFDQVCLCDIRLLIFDADPLNAMFREDSDYSGGDSADDNVMEGGVTIRMQTERKAPLVRIGS